MMRMLILFLLCWNTVPAQTIFAHNDYEKENPFFNAVHYKAGFIEADVYPVNGKLMVAHEKREIRADKTLENLYVTPIIRLLSSFPDSLKGVSLAIDIKEGGAETIEKIVELAGKHRRFFDITMNPGAVRIVISGDRGNMEDWNKYPEFIFFDGRPFEHYTDRILKRVALISDHYNKYIAADNPEDLSRLDSVLKKIKALGKPARFWASPDNPDAWKRLLDLGVDVINTDKVQKCREFISTMNY